MAEKNQQDIEQFLLGRLSTEEQAKLENAIADSKELRTALKREQVIQRGTEAYGRQMLKSELQQIHQEVIGKQAIQGRLPLRWMAIAASVLVLVIATVWILNRSADSGDLYANYYEPYELGVLQRSQVEAELYTAAEADRNKDYASALPLFKTLLESTPNQADLLLSTGVSHLELEQYALALPYFNQIIAGDNFLYRGEALWYAALTHLKLEDSVAARQQLEELTKDTAADHYQEALELLKKM